MKSLILETISRLVVFVILIFSIYLLLQGHHAPGGGFIAGLMTSATFVLQYVAFGIKHQRSILPLNFPMLIALGLLLSLGTGVVPMLFGKPFLTSAFWHLSLPVLGESEWATAVLFDLGVYLVVVGVTMTIITALGEN